MKFLERRKEAFNKVRFLDYYMEGHTGFIAGGCFKDIFKNKKVKDLDIFFEKENEFISAKEFFENNEDYVFSYENERAISFKSKKTNVRVELIRHVYGTAEEIISQFDFSIVKYAYAKRKGEEGWEYYNLFIDRFFEDLTNNKLVIDSDLKYPVSTFERSYRYRTYGFGLCRESKSKLIDSLKEADTDDLSNSLYFWFD